MPPRPRRKEGKVIKHVDIRTSMRNVPDVPLRLVSTRERRGGIEKFVYAIDIDEPAKFRVTHEDPTECVRLAQTELEKALGIAWTDKLRVTVDLVDMDGDLDAKPTDQASLRISFEPIQIGVSGTQAVWREVTERKVMERTGSKFEWTGETERDPSRSIRTSAPVLQDDIDQDDPHDWKKHQARTQEQALVDDTPENRERLTRIIDGLHRLGDEVRKVMSKDRIEATLRSSSGLMLSAPSTPAVVVPGKSKARDVARGKKRA